MLTEHGTMTTEAVYNDTKTERYRLTKIWDESKPIVSLLMINAGAGNEVVLDMTAMYCIRNLHALNVGGYHALNISSVIADKLRPDELTLSAANVQEIQAAVKSSEKLIICWGTIGQSNSKVAAVQRELLKQLKPFEDEGKVYTIVTDSGAGYHPIAPQVRHEWVLERFVRPDYLQERPEATPEPPVPTATSQTTGPEPKKATRQRQPKTTTQTA